MPASTAPPIVEPTSTANPRESETQGFLHTVIGHCFLVSFSLIR